MGRLPSLAIHYYLLLPHQPSSHPQSSRRFLASASRNGVSGINYVWSERMNSAKMPETSTSVLQQIGGGAEETSSSFISQRNHSNSEIDAAKPQPKTKPSNSYLKLLLDDSIIDALHHAALAMEDMTKTVSQEICAAYSDGNDNGARIGERNDNSSLYKRMRTPKPAITFKAMSRSYLHITVFFGGEDLCAISSEDLLQWHEYVSVQTRSINSNTMISMGQQSDQYMNPSLNVDPLPPRRDLPSSQDAERSVRLSFNDLSVFPPRRLNLVVAAFEAPPILHQLQNDILEYSSREGNPLQAVAKRNARGRWIPHITLGRIELNKQVVRIKSKLWTDSIEKILTAGRAALLEKMSSPLHTAASTSQLHAKAYGITMGGAMPAQVEVDWNIAFE